MQSKKIQNTKIEEILKIVYLNKNPESSDIYKLKFYAKSQKLEITDDD